MLEGVLSSEHNVKNNPKRPNISCKARVRLFLHDLWRHKRRGPAVDLQLRVLVTHDTEPKVDQFNLATVSNENIVHLDISMADSVLVHHFKSVGQHLEVAFDHGLLKPLVASILDNFE